MTGGSAVPDVINAIEREIGAIDILINSACIQCRTSLHEFVHSDRHALMQTNSDSEFFVA